VPPATGAVEPIGVAAADGTDVGGRPTYARVDLDALTVNVQAIRAVLCPGTLLMAVVKANGYGHGATMVARAAVAAGAGWLGVATVDEGVSLRRDGLVGPILVLGPIHVSEIAPALQANLSLAVGDLEMAHAIAASVRRGDSAGPAGVHLKVDTGMHRFGADPADTPRIAVDIAHTPGLTLGGVFTHFAAADEADETFTREQAARFDWCIGELRRVGVRPGVVHAANSAAALRSRRYGYDLVRVGIALYGIAPSPEIALPPGMRPILSLHTRIARVTSLAPGDTVSYGRTYRAARAERVALVPIGYADGYRRGFSSRAWMGIGGRRGPVRGRVCMDQTVVAVPDGVAARIGDSVVVAGDSACGAPTLDELADLVGTIAYEIATGIAPRVPRRYVRDGRVVAVEDLHGLRDVAAAGAPGPSGGDDVGVQGPRLAMPCVGGGGEAGHGNPSPYKIQRGEMRSGALTVPRARTPRRGGGGRSC